MKQLTQFGIMFTAITLALLLGSCKSPGGETSQDKRTSVLEMRTETLNSFYAAKPALEAHIKKAPGYAVFSNYGFKLFVAGTGNGYGVARDNSTGKDTFMRMGEVNVGLGFGGKDFRLLFVFRTAAAMHDFVNKGWSIGADAEAGAKASKEGAELGMAIQLGDIEIYQITKTGLTLQATVGGTKYWKDADLN